MPADGAGPRILCAGIVVLDEIWRVPRVPPIDSKIDAREFAAVSGGCAANAAVAIARLGGRASFAGPLGDDDVSRRTHANLTREGVDTAGCVQVAVHARRSPRSWPMAMLAA